MRCRAGPQRLDCFALPPEQAAGQKTWENLVVWNIFPRASERRVLPIVGVCISSSHLHTFSSSHLLSHLLIFTSSLTPSHLHIFSSSHLLSHLLIFTPSHLHIFSHTFSSSHLLSHLLIFSHTLLIFTPSHLHIFSLSHSLSFLSLLSLSFFSLAFFIFLSLGRGWYRR